jgi:hypothetical protein
MFKAASPCLQESFIFCQHILKHVTCAHLHELIHASSLNYYFINKSYHTQIAKQTAEMNPGSTLMINEAMKKLSYVVVILEA